MALGVDPQAIYERIGHDGSQKLWNLPEPICRRGFHPQELIHAFPEIGAFTPVERYPRLAPTSLAPNSGTTLYALPACSFWDETILTGRGVLEGLTASKRRHAVAFERGQVFDPDTGTAMRYPNTRIDPQLAWVLHESHEPHQPHVPDR